jgi:hypothetical protein
MNEAEFSARSDAGAETPTDLRGRVACCDTNRIPGLNPVSNTCHQTTDTQQPIATFLLCILRLIYALPQLDPRLLAHFVAIAEELHFHQQDRRDSLHPNAFRHGAV